MFEKSIHVFCIVVTLAPSILIGSSSFLEVTRITITFWMSSNLSQIQPWTAELAALECLKNKLYFDQIFKKKQNKKKKKKKKKKKTLCQVTVLVDSQKKKKKKKKKTTFPSDCTC